MKKKIFLAMFLSSITFAGFLDGMSEIDKFLQKEDYQSAYNVGQELLKEDLSEDDKQVLLTILEEIDSKIPKNQEILVKLKIGDEKAPEINNAISAGDFRKLKSYEKEILESNNPVMINEYAKFYAKSGLLESAYNFALKDKTRSTQNVYLAATAARMIGEYDKAISLYNEVLNKSPNYPKALLGLGVCYKMKKNYKKAASYLRKYSSFVNSPEIQSEIRSLETLE